MKSGFGTKIGITLVVLAACLYQVFGLSPRPEDIKAHLAEVIKLGLDLKGGTHLILQVQVQDALKSEADQTIDRLRRRLRTDDIAYKSIARNDPDSIETADTIEITIEGAPIDRAGDVRDLLELEAPSWLATSTSSDSFRLRLRPSELVRLKGETLQQSIATIENRINGLGLAEPVIQQHGRAEAEHEILVQLPGVSDPARVMNLLQMSAHLEITLVLDGPYPSQAAARSSNGGILPANSKLAHWLQPGLGKDEWYLLERTPVVTGRDLRNAQAGRDTQYPGQWQVAFSLSRQAGQRFGIFTANNIQKPLAVVLDRRIQSVATIQSRIESEGVINQMDSQIEATDLALVLRAGALPASVVYLGRAHGRRFAGARTRSGKAIASALYGVAIIVVVMLLYYKAAGINANVRLVFQPGDPARRAQRFRSRVDSARIAGIILTIGMAVDAMC